MSTDSVGGVVCVGEPLVLAGAQAELHLAGAEANVAAGLVSWGIPAAFVGRLGDDGYGELIRSELTERGVDISAGEPGHV
ncbi:PfkB family carbohydrate kinase, partial [Mycolicibacterium porcinum]|uniref:PfkB family carbohydrate kinase n=1 Tax=Mycolicibacterium porcinum TaxID=39693 RepID=UPI0034CE24F6